MSSYVPKVGDRVWAHSKGDAIGDSADHAAVYTDWEWFSGKIIKVKVVCIHCSSYHCPTFVSNTLFCLFIKVTVIGRFRKKCYCDIAFDNGNVEEGTPLVRSSNVNTYNIKPLTAEEALALSLPASTAQTTSQT